MKKAAFDGFDVRMQDDATGMSDNLYRMTEKSTVGISVYHPKWFDGVLVQ